MPLFNNSEREIEDVQYLNGENLGDGYSDRRSVFDVYCMTKDGSRFIVEMQKAEQTRLLERPKALQDRIFQKLFEQAEIAKYSEAERRQYEASQKDYWDYTSTLETAERKGEQKEKLKIVHRMNAKGYSVEDISEVAGLSVDEIRLILQ